MKKTDNSALKIIGAFTLGAAAGAAAVIAAHFMKPLLSCRKNDVIPCDDVCDCCCDTSNEECCECESPCCETSEQQPQ